MPKKYLTLDLSRKGIKDITEIKGLEARTRLQVLNLSHNQIGEIKGLDTLKNLVKLDLSHNKIAEIRGLRNLTKLRILNLKGNRFVNIEGFENLINLKKLIFGFSHWDVDHLNQSINLVPNHIDLGLYVPNSALILNGKILTAVEKYVVRGGAKKIVAYCRVKLKQAGYTKALVPADSKIKKLEEKIIKKLKDTEKKIKSAIREKYQRDKFIQMGRR